MSLRLDLKSFWCLPKCENSYTSHPTMDFLATITNITLIQGTLPIQIKEQPWIVLGLLNS